MDSPLALSPAVLAAGDVLTVFGGLCTAGVPAGAVLWALGWAREGAMLCMPLVVCILLAAAYIKQQKAGLRKGGLSTWAVARLTLWPTVAYNTLRDLVGERPYYDEVHPGVFVGGAPTRRLAQRLVTKHGVRSVVNCCEEFGGPDDIYKSHGAEEFRLRCIDFCDVPYDKICRSVEWVEGRVKAGLTPVYIHCKSGKGRAVTVATAYIGKCFVGGDLEAANTIVKKARPTAIGTVYRRPAMQEFALKQCERK